MARLVAIAVDIGIAAIGVFAGLAVAWHRQFEPKPGAGRFGEQLAMAQALIAAAPAPSATTCLRRAFPPPA